MRSTESSTKVRAGEREGGRCGVIVQVPPDERTTYLLVGAPADVLRWRNVSLTTSDLLLVSQEALEDLRNVASRDHITDRATGFVCGRLGSRPAGLEPASF